jgi:hypothetical protein
MKMQNGNTKDMLIEMCKAVIVLPITDRQEKHTQISHAKYSSSIH